MEMKPFVDEAKGPSRADPRPGEIHFRVSIDLFMPGNEWIQDCRTVYDSLQDLTNILEEGRTKRRVVVKGFEIVPSKP
jgi:hypothetical protein